MNWEFNFLWFNLFQHKVSCKHELNFIDPLFYNFANVALLEHYHYLVILVIFEYFKVKLKHWITLNFLVYGHFYFTFLWQMNGLDSLLARCLTLTNWWALTNCWMQHNKRQRKFWKMPPKFENCYELTMNSWVPPLLLLRATLRYAMKAQWNGIAIC